MSGIAGIIRFDDAPVEPALIKKMTDSMSYRGPDGINHWIKGSVALGQCMLCTTPESLEEHQPLTNEDESLVLVMDGRVDNWEELRKDLLKRGVRLRNRSDAELVLRSYELWGEDCLAHLYGDFAFAIWDNRLQCIFLARDPIGVKPCYYFRSGKLFAFTSDETALLKLPGFLVTPKNTRIAPDLVPEYAGDHYHVGWFDAASKLAPGSLAIIFADGKVKQQSYWQLDADNELNLTSPGEYEELFETLFASAIHKQSRSLGDIGLLLSGGIDSVSIALFAQTHQNQFQELQQLQAYSVISDNIANCDETNNILHIIEEHVKASNKVHVPSLSGLISLEDLYHAAWSNPHPITNSILLPAILYMAASRKDCHVMFDGIDGDLTTHAPSNYITHLFRSDGWRHAWRESNHASHHHTYLKERSTTNIFLRALWGNRAPRSIKTLRNAWRTRNINDFLSASYMSEDFAQRFHLNERIQEQRSESTRLAATETERQRHIRVITEQGISWSMEAFNMVSAMHQIESRHPWSDRKLIEYFVSLPLSLKVRNGWTKWLVRNACTTKSKSTVCWHSGKNHLGIYLVLILMQHHRPYLLEMLQNCKSCLTPYVNVNKLESDLQMYIKNPSTFANYDVYRLYKTLSIGLWLDSIKKLD